VFRYTSKKGSSGLDVYAFLLLWPESSQVVMGSPITTSETKISMLGYGAELKFTKNPQGGITVQLPMIPISKVPCQWAWTLKLVGLGN